MVGEPHPETIFSSYVMSTTIPSSPFLPYALSFLHIYFTLFLSFIYLPNLSLLPFFSTLLLSFCLLSLFLRFFSLFFLPSFLLPLLLSLLAYSFIYVLSVLVLSPFNLAV
jgi:hypothetical protein